MANFESATISSASGETAFLMCPNGTGTISLAGDITGGAVCVVVRTPGASGDYVSDRIDQTAIRETANEAETGYAYVAPFQVALGSSIALKASASFVGSVTALVTADPY